MNTKPDTYLKIWDGIGRSVATTQRIQVQADDWPTLDHTLKTLAGDRTIQGLTWCTVKDGNGNELIEASGYLVNKAFCVRIRWVPNL